MGGGGPQDIGSRDAMQLRALAGQMSQGMNSSFLPAVQGAQKSIGQGLTQLQGQFNPTFRAGAYRPDQYTQGILSQGDQSMRNNVGSIQRDLQAKFANNPMMAKILGGQAMANGQLSQNPLNLQAAIMQRGRQVEEQNMTNSSAAQLFGLQSNAANNQAQLASMPMQAQQNLLGTLASLYQTPGMQRNESKSSSGYDPMFFNANKSF